MSPPRKPIVEWTGLERFSLRLDSSSSYSCSQHRQQRRTGGKQAVWHLLIIHSEKASQIPDIIGLFVAGWLFLIAFAIWEHFLELRIDNLDLARSSAFWDAPPIMRLSMWTRARGRFAVMQMIACMNWAAFTCWQVWVQQYYQTFLGLSPILTMVRVIPMLPVGIAANVLIALLIARVDVQYIISKAWILSLENHV